MPALFCPFQPKCFLAVFHNGRAVGDEEDGLVLLLGLQGNVFYQLALRFGIQGTSGFVQKEDVALAQEGPGYGYTLGLAFRQASSAFAANGVHGIGEREDEVGTCHAQDLVHVCLGGVGVAQKEVVADGAAEQGVALGNVDKVATGVGRCHGAGIAVVHKFTPAKISLTRSNHIFLPILPKDYSRQNIAYYTFS